MATQVQVQTITREQVIQQMWVSCDSCGTMSHKNDLKNGTRCSACGDVVIKPKRTKVR